MVDPTGKLREAKLIWNHSDKSTYIVEWLDQTDLLGKVVAREQSSYTGETDKISWHQIYTSEQENQSLMQEQISQAIDQNMSDLLSGLLGQGAVDQEQ